MDKTIRHCFIIILMMLILLVPTVSAKTEIKYGKAPDGTIPPKNPVSASYKYTNQMFYDTPLYDDAMVKTFCPSRKIFHYDFGEGGQKYFLGPNWFKFQKYFAAGFAISRNGLINEIKKRGFISKNFQDRMSQLIDLSEDPKKFKVEDLNVDHFLQKDFNFDKLLQEAKLDNSFRQPAVFFVNRSSYNDAYETFKHELTHAFFDVNQDFRTNVVNAWYDDIVPTKGEREVFFNAIAEYHQDRENISKISYEKPEGYGKKPNSIEKLYLGFQNWETYSVITELTAYTVEHGGLPRFFSKKHPELSRRLIPRVKKAFQEGKFQLPTDRSIRKKPLPPVIIPDPPREIESTPPVVVPDPPKDVITSQEDKRKAKIKQLKAQVLELEIEKISLITPESEKEFIQAAIEKIKARIKKLESEGAGIQQDEEGDFPGIEIDDFGDSNNSPNRPLRSSAFSGSKKPVFVAAEKYTCSSCRLETCEVQQDEVREEEEEVDEVGEEELEGQNGYEEGEIEEKDDFEQEETGNLSCEGFDEDGQIGIDVCKLHKGLHFLKKRYCKSIADSYVQDTCYSLIAKQSQTPEICSSIQDQFERDNCYSIIASDTLESSVCNSIGDVEGQNQCRDIIEQQKAAGIPPVEKQSHYCLFAETDQQSIDACYALFALSTHDPSICENLVDPETKISCIALLAEERDRYLAIQSNPE